MLFGYPRRPFCACSQWLAQVSVHANCIAQLQVQNPGQILTRVLSLLCSLAELAISRANPFLDMHGEV